MLSFGFHFTIFSIPNSTTCHYCLRFGFHWDTFATWLRSPMKAKLDLLFCYTKNRLLLYLGNVMFARLCHINNVVWWGFDWKCHRYLFVVKEFSSPRQCSKLRLKRSHMQLKLWFCDLNLRKVAELRTKLNATIESVFVWSGEFNLFYTDSFSGVNIMSYVKAQEFRINVNNSW